MADSGKYIYCVIEKKNGISGKLELGDCMVSFVSFKDIALAVRDSDPLDYQRLPKEILLSHLNCHQKIVEMIMQKYLPLPFKFGTCLKDQAEVMEVLKEGYSFFKEELRSIKGKLEIEVIANFHNMEEVFCEIGNSPRVEEFKQEVFSSTQSPSAEEKIKLGQMVKTLLDEKKDKLSKEILAHLKKISEDFCAHAVLNDTMILNAGFLIKGENKDAFYHAVEELNKIYQDKIDFKCIGPIPMYSFNTIEIARVDIEFMEHARRKLELNGCTSINKIKENYRRLAKKYHPDKNEASKKEFEEASKAYEFLMDFCQNYNFSLSTENIKKEKFLRKFKVKI